MHCKSTSQEPSRLSLLQLRRMSPVLGTNESKPTVEKKLMGDRCNLHFKFGTHTTIRVSLDGLTALMVCALYCTVQYVGLLRRLTIKDINRGKSAVISSRE